MAAAALKLRVACGAGRVALRGWRRRHLHAWRRLPAAGAAGGQPGAGLLRQRRRGLPVHRRAGPQQCCQACCLLGPICACSWAVPGLRWVAACSSLGTLLLTRSMPCMLCRRSCPSGGSAASWLRGPSCGASCRLGGRVGRHRLAQDLALPIPALKNSDCSCCRRCRPLPPLRAAGRL